MIEKIYLAGGFKSNWGAMVEKECSGFLFINPKNKEYKNEERVIMNVNEYGKWDLHFIKSCDIVFANVESGNPSCIGLACEIGFAKGLGKTVILILPEKHDYIDVRYLEFLTQVSDIVFTGLIDGINYLKSFKI